MQQEALSLLQFQKKFGTEKACQKQLFRMRWPEGFKCPHCSHYEAYFHSTRIRGVHHGVSTKHLLAIWQNSFTDLTAASGNRKCSIACFILA